MSSLPKKYCKTPLVNFPNAYTVGESDALPDSYFASEEDQTRFLSDKTNAKYKLLALEQNDSIVPTSPVGRSTFIPTYFSYGDQARLLLQFEDVEHVRESLDELNVSIAFLFVFLLDFCICLRVQHRLIFFFSSY